MFERSAAGLNNRALFYGVRYTCYVEGGGQDHDRSVDAFFWENVLSFFRADLSIVFLPRGGKPILEGLAQKIIQNNIANTIVAIDSDYDEALGHRITDSRVLYSHGYSWENDVFEEEFIATLVRIIARKSSLPSNVRDKLSVGYKDFSNSARRFILADLLALIAGSSVLPRESPGRVIRADGQSGFPCFEKREILKLIELANAATKPRPLVQEINLPSRLFWLVGHCLGHGIAILVKAALKELGVRKMPSSDHLQDVAIMSINRNFRSHPTNPVTQHHQRQCAAIP